MKKCPNCNHNLKHIKGVKEKIIMTLDGFKEWSFNSSDFCRKCNYKKEYDDIIKKDPFNLWKEQRHKLTPNEA